MARQALRIVLAEDDRFLRKATETTLRRRGFTVYSAADGEEALRMSRDEKPDAILLDMIMPKLQGFEVLRTLKADPDTARIPIIVLSNLGQDEDKQGALECGAAAYFIKADLSLQNLVAQVERVLEERPAQ